jgi:hypothetical protein
VHEILFTVANGFEQTTLAPLSRPNVPNDSPNEALVVETRYYVSCVIAHLRIVLPGLAQLVEDDNIPAAFPVCRHVFEWTAHTCYVSRHLDIYLYRNKWGRAWHLLTLASEGNRWVKEHGAKYVSDAAIDGVPDPLSVPNIIACYDAYRNQVGQRADAKDSYGLLSEHSHPNSACFHAYCQYEGSTVAFGPPKTEMCLFGVWVPEILSR